MESISSMIGSARLSSSRSSSARRMQDTATFEAFESPAYQPVGGKGADCRGREDSRVRKVDGRRRFAILWSEGDTIEGHKTFAEKAVDCISGWPYQSSMGLVIVANSVVIGFETDLPHYPHWNNVEHTFLAIFTFELVWRIIAFGPRVFFDLSSSDMAWNVFDCSIVLLGIFDMLLSLLLGSNESSASATQVFRVVRLLRILRIFRIVRFLKPLYMLAFGLVLAAEAIMWVSVLMMFVLYVCSIILVRSVGNMPEETPHKEFLEGCFGSVFQSMYTLFELMVNPYLDPYHPVLAGQPIFAVFIIGFVVFGSFGMIALLTGVIHETMFEKNQLRAEEERQEQETKRMLLVRRCGELFDEVDTDGLGVPRDRYDELEDLLPKVADMFKTNGVSLVEDDLVGIIDLMDADGSGTIEKEEFCHFFLRVAEGVRPLLLMEFRQELMAFTGQRLEGIMSDLQRVLKTNLAATEASTKLLRKEIQEVSRQVQDLLAGQSQSTQLCAELSGMKDSFMDAITSGEARDLAMAQRETTKVLVGELKSCVDQLVRQRGTAPSSPGVRSHSAAAPPSPGCAAVRIGASGEARQGSMARSAPRVEAVPAETDRTRFMPVASDHRSMPSVPSRPGPGPDRAPGIGGAPEESPPQWQRVPSLEAAGDVAPTADPRSGHMNMCINLANSGLRFDESAPQGLLSGPVGDGGRRTSSSSGSSNGTAGNAPAAARVSGEHFGEAP